MAEQSKNPRSKSVTFEGVSFNTEGNFKGMTEAQFIHYGVENEIYGDKDEKKQKEMLRAAYRHIFQNKESFQDQQSEEDVKK